MHKKRYTSDRYVIFKFINTISSETKKARELRWKRATTFTTFMEELFSFVLKKEWAQLHQEHHVLNIGGTAYDYYRKVLGDKYKILLVKYGKFEYLIYPRNVPSVLEDWVEENLPDFAREINGLVEH